MLFAGSQTNWFSLPCWSWTFFWKRVIRSIGGHHTEYPWLLDRNWFTIEQQGVLKAQPPVWPGGNSIAIKMDRIYSNWFVRPRPRCKGKNRRKLPRRPMELGEGSWAVILPPPRIGQSEGHLISGVVVVVVVGSCTIYWAKFWKDITNLSSLQIECSTTYVHIQYKFIRLYAVHW